MKDRITVAVVEFNSSGGLIHYAYQLCNALAEQQVDVILITGTDYELKAFPHRFQVWNRLRLWAVFDPDPIQVHSGNALHRSWAKIKKGVRRGTRAIKLIREWLRLTDQLSRRKPDIVQFGEIKFAFEAFFLEHLRRKGIVLTQICHEFENREHRSWMSSLSEPVYRRVFKNFSAIFFHAQQNRDRFLLKNSYPTEKAHLIPHGNEKMFLTAVSEIEAAEDLRQKYGIPADARVVLFFGTLTPSKGIEDLIDAFAMVRGRTRAKLVIAGYPSKYMDVNALRKRTADLNLSADVVFDTRYIPIGAIKPLMELATVVVFPYHNATQSGSLQVAYAFGRPVVATAVGGMKEVVHEGRTGFLVPPRETEKLAEKIVEILNTPQLAQTMGAEAQRLSETLYGWNPIARSIAIVYRKLAGHSGHHQ